MPQAIRRACRSGCPHFQPCPVHGKGWALARVASSVARGYGAEHLRLRLQVIAEEPTCRACVVRRSTIADHIVPLSRGGQTVRENLQGLCERCSRSKSGREGRAARATLASGLQAGPRGDAQGVYRGGRSENSARPRVPR